MSTNAWGSATASNTLFLAIIPPDLQHIPGQIYQGLWRVLRRKGPRQPSTWRLRSTIFVHLAFDRQTFSSFDHFVVRWVRWVRWLFDTTMSLTLKQPP